MASPTVTFDELRRSLHSGDYRPLYLLHGKEGYYIDVLVKQFEAIVPEEDRDFGLNVIYAPEVEPAHIIDVCRQLPMMTDRQVVIIKEAQAVNNAYLEKLERYALSPTPSTILVVAARGEDVAPKKFMEAVRKAGGVVFQSKRVYDNQIPSLVTGYIKEKGLHADTKAVEMLSEFIGTDLSRLYNEIDKLVEILGKGAMVTPESIERNIGVSKDYNVFELIDAVASRNLVKIYRISDYFAASPKRNPVQPVASTLFSFFSDMLVAYYAPDKSERGLMQELGTRNGFNIRRVQLGMRNYNAFQVVDALSEIRRFDLMSKGGGSRQSGHKLLHDLLFRLVTTTGR